MRSHQQTQHVAVLRRIKAEAKLHVQSWWDNALRPDLDPHVIGARPRALEPHHCDGADKAPAIAARLLSSPRGKQQA